MKAENPLIEVIVTVELADELANVREALDGDLEMLKS